MSDLRVTDSTNHGMEKSMTKAIGTEDERKKETVVCSGLAIRSGDAEQVLVLVFVANCLCQAFYMSICCEN